MKVKGLVFKLIILTTLLTMVAVSISCSSSQSAQTSTQPAAQPTTASPSSTTSQPAHTSTQPTTTSPSSTTSQPAQKVIKLKLLSGFAANDPSNYYIQPFIDEVNKLSNGTLVINYAGGPEVISSNDQANALQTGVIDLSFNVATRFAGELPAIKCISLSRLTPSEEQANGYNDFINGLFKSVNVKYLSRGLTPTLFTLCLNKQVSSPSELAGLKIRSTATYAPFISALKAVGVSISDTDTYNGMQTGVIQGFILPIWTAEQMKLYEVTKYFIDTPIYTSGTVAMMANLNSFNSLPKNLQDVLLKAAADVEQQTYSHFSDLGSQSRDYLTSHGMTPIKFSTADANSFLDTAYNSAWDALAKNVPADVVAKAKQLSSK